MIFLCCCVMAGCAPSLREGSIAGNDYQVDILIGHKRGPVLKNAERIFGQPKQVGSIFEKSDYEVELRRYHFTNVSDFVMYFYKDIFVQAGLMPVDSPGYPPLRSDYQAITASEPGPVLGYTLFMNDHEVVVDTIQP